MTGEFFPVRKLSTSSTVSSSSTDLFLDHHFTIDKTPMTGRARRIIATKLFLSVHQQRSKAWNRLTTLTDPLF